MQSVREQLQMPLLDAVKRDLCKFQLTGCLGDIVVQQFTWNSYVAQETDHVWVDQACHLQPRHSLTSHV